MTVKQETGPGPYPGQFSRTLHLFALVQVAIAYPVYDLLSRNPEFFVARQSQAGDIWFVVLALSVVLPLGLFGLQVMLARINEHAGRTVYLLLIAILFLLLGLSASQNALDGPAHFVFGVVFCLLLTVVYWRGSVGRLFVSFLSPAILLVPALFVLNEDVASLLQPVESNPQAERSVNPATTPVIFIIFDELPTFALLDESGNIDADLFPNFHALAESSYWYPNATTVATSTVLAIPAILTGRYPVKFVMPHQGEYPDNLFTWLGSDYDLNVREAVSAMCPATLCGTGRLPPLEIRLHHLLLDVSAIYLNIITPDLLRGRLPVVTQSWENFWSATKPEAGMYEHRLQQLDDFAARIKPSGKPGLDFMHANFPHIPYEYLPSGKRYQEGWLMPGLDFAIDSWTGAEWQSAQAYERFLLQLGALDGWLGKLIAKLKAEDLYDRTLIVITADHGVSFTPNSSRRDVPPVENLDANILPVPLIIKAPYQEKGWISHRNAETIDIMPTLADLLERPLTWPVDGVSLLKDPKPAGKRTVHSYKELEVYLTNVERVTTSSRPPWTNKRFPGRGGVIGAYRDGSYRELIGQEVARLPIRRNAGLTARIDHAAYFENVDPGSGFLPAHISGSMKWPDRGEIDLAIALNGRIAVVTSTYTGGSSWKFSAMLPESAFRSGENDIEVFAIEAGDSDGFVLVAGSPVPAGGDYTWNADVDSVNYAGSNLPTDPIGIKGVVDYISLGEEAVEILGWAIDSANARAVKAILVFEGPHLVYKGGTHMLREETHQFGVVIEVGFHAVIPFGQMQDSSGAGLRVFAVTEDDRALEISREGTDQPAY
jgi:hypothetical protein